MKIDRVILATNLNEKYIQFWPIVAQAWQELVGVRPTLILIAPKTVHVDESYGDVVYFEPLPDLPTSYQSQVIRLFAPVLFPEDVCILGDIDMLPLQKEYFTDAVKEYAEDLFVVFRKYENNRRYPMCYVAGQGKTFQSIFNITWQDVPERLRAWKRNGYGWNTDELMMAEAIHDWPECLQRVIFLNDTRNNRITRLFWGYDESLIKNNGYIDAHLMRPYVEYKSEIDVLMSQLGLSSKIDTLLAIPFTKTLINNHSDLPLMKHEILESLHDEFDVVVSINSFDNVSGTIKNYQTITEFISNPQDSFIRLLMINFAGLNSVEIEKMQHLIKYHQIGSVYIDFNNGTIESKMATRVLYKLLSQAGYVLFKFTPEGLMHIPSRSSLGVQYYKGNFIAFAPQYARGWASIQDK